MQYTVFADRTFFTMEHRPHLYDQPPARVWRKSLPQTLGNLDSLHGSLYASTILSMENEEDEANQSTLNDQQWVLQVI